MIVTIIITTTIYYWDNHYFMVIMVFRPLLIIYNDYFMVMIIIRITGHCSPCSCVFPCVFPRCFWWHWSWTAGSRCRAFSHAEGHCHHTVSTSRTPPSTEGPAVLRLAVLRGDPGCSHSMLSLTMRNHEKSVMHQLFAMLKKLSTTFTQPLTSHYPAIDQY